MKKLNTPFLLLAVMLIMTGCSSFRDENALEDPSLDAPEAVATDVQADSMQANTDAIPSDVPNVDAEAAPPAPSEVASDLPPAPPQDSAPIADAVVADAAPMAPIDAPAEQPMPVTDPQPMAVAEPAAPVADVAPVAAIEPVAEAAPMAAVEPVSTGEEKSYSVKSGDTLMKIAFENYGDLYRWKEIYEANREKIQDPNHVPPGTELTLNGAGRVTIERNGEQYLIKNGDTLGTISKDVYGTQNKWKVLWENNRTLIKDPNRIYAGFYLYYQPQGQMTKVDSENSVGTL